MHEAFTECIYLGLASKTAEVPSDTSCLSLNVQAMDSHEEDVRLNFYIVQGQLSGVQLSKISPSSASSGLNHLINTPDLL